MCFLLCSGKFSSTFKSINVSLSPGSKAKQKKHGHAGQDEPKVLENRSLSSDAASVFMQIFVALY